MRLRWTLIATSAQLLFLVALALFDRQFAAAGPDRWAGKPLTYAICMTAGAAAAYLMLMLPIYYHLCFRLRRRFSLTARDKPIEALTRLGKRIIRLIFCVIFILVLVFLSRRYLGPWWPAALGLLLGYIVVNMVRTPRKVLGCEIKSPADSPQTQALERFARSQGIADLQLRSLEASSLGTEAIAAYLPFSAKPRVYLSDTLTDILEDRELVAVFAHELGHHRKGHLLGQLVLEYLVFVVAAAAVHVVLRALAPDAHSAWQAVQAAPWVLLTAWLVIFAGRPIALAASRHNERLANAWALEATGDPAAFISAMKKLAANNLIAGRPCWWEKLFLASHPSLDEVTGQARHYAERCGISLDNDF